MNILFVCTANRDRSRTAEIYFQNKYPEHRFRSCGIDKYLSEEHGGIHMKRYMLDIADIIICMEYIHSTYILNRIDGIYLDKLRMMHIEDTETFMQKELIGKLEKAMIEINIGI